MKRLLLTLSLILLTILFVPSVLAQEPGSEPGRVVFGSDLTLEEDDFVKGDVVVFGGNFEMLSGSEVDGSVVVFGGKVTIDGKVEADVAAMGGEVTIKDNAVVKGDVTAVGGEISVSEDADVRGSVAEGPEFKVGEDGFTMEIPATPAIPDVPNVPDVPDLPSRPNVEGRSFFGKIGEFFGDGFSDIFMALIMAGLAALVVTFFPAHVKNVESSLVQATPISFVVGLITTLAAGALFFLLAILSILIVPICGIFLEILALMAATLMGLTVIGKLVGRKIFSAGRNPTAGDLSATLLGVGLVVLLGNMPFVDKLPLIGWAFGLTGALVIMLVTWTGLGAVVLSRLGTQVYKPGPRAVAVMAPSPAPIAPVAPETPADRETDPETPNVE